VVLSIFFDTTLVAFEAVFSIWSDNSKKHMLAHVTVLVA